MPCIRATITRIALHQWKPSRREAIGIGIAFVIGMFLGTWSHSEAFLSFIGAVVGAIVTICGVHWIETRKDNRIEEGHAKVILPILRRIRANLHAIRQVSKKINDDGSNNITDKDHYYVSSIIKPNSETIKTYIEKNNAHLIEIIPHGLELASLLNQTCDHIERRYRKEPGAILYNFPSENLDEMENIINTMITFCEKKSNASPEAK